jgi:hypothetical protein
MTSPPSPLLFRIHVGLTAVLLAGLLVLAGLVVAGRAHFGSLPPPPAAQSDQKAAASADGDRAKDQEKPKSDEKEGRYQIEVMDDARQMLGDVGKLGVLGDRVHEAWVFHYKGGFLECKLETDFDGKPVSSGKVPEEWARFLSQDDAVRQGKPEALHKEGYIVLLGMTSVVSVGDALKPLHHHLGAMFTTGPAGPLHALIPYYHEVWRQREYRLFVSAGPPKGKTGQGFNLWTGDLILVRSHFIDSDPDQDPAHTTGGKDLEPGKELTVLDRTRGLSKIRLKARFLTDQEAFDMARAQATP